jgi:hypothetical protein
MADDIGKVLVGDLEIEPIGPARDGADPAGEALENGVFLSQ